MCKALGRDRPWDAIISSPLSRCLAFATELSQDSKIPLETDDRLKEIGFGEWQGKTSEEITRFDPGVVQRFYRDPTTYRPDGAEGLAEFRTRVTQALRDILDRHAGQHVLVICHAGIIRMALAQILEIPLSNLFRIKVANASVTRVEYAEQGEEFLGQLIFHAGSLQH
jgi:alpha-ribazole phosphatase/probable phosphoglycerate mutase